MPRTCKRCGLEKPDSDYRFSTLPSGLVVQRKACWDCEKAARKERWHTHGKPWRCVVFGDLHFPFHHRPGIEWALGVCRNLKPHLVVQVGDLLDMFSFSRYPRTQNLMTPAEELERGRASAVWFWEGVAKASPHAKRLQLTGNHDSRPYSRVLDKAPELESLIGPGLKDLFTFDGVETVRSEREEVERNGVVFMHGHRSRLGQHAQWHQKPTVCGHSHHGGMLPFVGASGIFWELNAGCLIDIGSPVFGYRAQKRFHNVTLGLGVIDELGPRFVPYPGQAS